MARYINGRLATSSQDKKEAVESAGGNYNETIEGDYVQGDVIDETVEQEEFFAAQRRQKKKQKSQPKNYVENLGGEQIEDFL